MTTLILEVYDAFKSVGIDDDTARKAAGALSENPRQIAELKDGMNDRFDSLADQINGRFEKFAEQTNGRFEKLQADINAIRTEQVVVRAMFAILVAGVASIVLKLYF